MAKYDPLTEHLDRCGVNRLSLTFAEIDEMVGGLPPTALKKNEWWANEDVRTTRHSQCKSWQQAGFHASVDRSTGTVAFVKN